MLFITLLGPVLTNVSYTSIVLGAGIHNYHHSFLCCVFTHPCITSIEVCLKLKKGWVITFHNTTAWMWLSSHAIISDIKIKVAKCIWWSTKFDIQMTWWRRSAWRLIYIHYICIYFRLLNELSWECVQENVSAQGDLNSQPLAEWSTIWGISLTKGCSWERVTRLKPFIWF